MAVCPVCSAYSGEAACRGSRQKKGGNRGCSGLAVPDTKKQGAPREERPAICSRCGIRA